MLSFDIPSMRVLHLDFDNRFTQSHSKHPEYKYPVIMWDLLPHGGASQVHPHLQLVLKSHRYPGRFIGGCIHLSLLESTSYCDII